MPNWCENTLEICGDEDKMKEFYDFFGGIELPPVKVSLKTKTINQLNKMISKLGVRVVPYNLNFDRPKTKFEENFSFNMVTTLPQELDGTRSPSNIVSQEDYDRYTQLEKKHNIKDTQDVNRLVEDGTLTDEERELLWKEGITQEMSDMRKSEYGYDNWYDWQVNNWGTKWDLKELVANELDDYQCTLVFQTAWCPPEPIVDKLREMFPDLEFYGVWIEEGYQSSGVL